MQYSSMKSKPPTIHIDRRHGWVLQHIQFMLFLPTLFLCLKSAASLAFCCWCSCRSPHKQWNNRQTLDLCIKDKCTSLSAVPKVSKSQDKTIQGCSVSCNLCLCALMCACIRLHVSKGSFNSSMWLHPLFSKLWMQVTLTLWPHSELPLANDYYLVLCCRQRIQKYHHVELIFILNKQRGTRNITEQLSTMFRDYTNWIHFNTSNHVLYVLYKNLFW